MDENLELRIRNSEKARQQRVALIEVFSVVRSIPNHGLLQDLVYLLQHIGGMPELFKYDVPHVRPGELASSDLAVTLDELKKLRVIYGDDWFEPLKPGYTPEEEARIQEEVARYC